MQRIKPVLFPASQRHKINVIAALRSAGSLPITINDVYIPHYFAPERIQIWYGGSGAGKSDAKATELLLKCLTDPFRRVLFMRKFSTQIRDSQFLLFKDLINRYGFERLFTVKESEMDIICNINGNMLLSAGLDDVDKLKSVADVTDAWIEEPLDKKGSIKDSDFTELNRRLRCPLASNHIHLTFNPVSKDSWINDYFFKSDKYGARTVRTTYRDNAYTPADQARQFEILKEDNPEEYRVYGLGEWGTLRHGLVYPDYSLCTTFPDDCKKVGYGLDWGFYPDPCAIVKCGIKDGVLFLDEMLYETNHTSGTRAKAMQEVGIKPGSKIVADRNPEAIKELALKGFHSIMPAQKGPGSVKAGIDTVKRFKIVVTERSKNIRTELDNYSWAVDRMSGKPTGEPEDNYNHAMDAIRYWVIEESTIRRGATFAR